MNTTMHKLVVAMGTVVMAGGAWALDNATASASADVLTPISIAKNTDMAFGSLVIGNGLVTLSTAGARTKAGTTALPTSGTSPAAAKFTVTGTGANTFSIDTTGSDSTLTDGSSNTMAITWLVEAQSGTTAASGITSAGNNSTTGTLASGTATIYGGGLLTVGAAQVAGAYTGNLKITVAYN